ncbi:hypothetical protein B0G84_5145 [Paraburkholderia sp. BL8N3]|jgi:hypothetical protein|nr:hypothetical protein [Paraburkholderia sp. BL8N3]TCK36165.1 hypothetical protein B0G84_5145 [Paraburkholderia sp. BL8N3]
MKMTVAFLIALFLLTTRVLVAGAAIRYEQDATPNGAATFDIPGAALTSNQESSYDEMLMANGVDPGSNKARVIVAWIRRIQHDPVIRANVHSIRRLFMDAQTRANLMADGVARLAPADRLRYARLITKFLDVLVPPDCFGMNDMSEVMSRISLNEVADADIDEYLQILLEALRSSASAAPIDIPTPQQYAAAEITLGRALASELGNDKANLTRYEAYMANPKRATPTEACWGLRVTMHAILAMPEPDRDIVLRYVVTPRSAQVTPSPRRP